MDPTTRDPLAQLRCILKAVHLKILEALSLAFLRTNGLVSVVVNRATSEYCHLSSLILFLDR